MKKLIYLLIVSFVMLFSCSKDMLTDENLYLKKDFLNDENLYLKRANVPVPFKGEMTMTINYAVPLKPVENTPVVDPSSGKVLVPQLYTAGQAWLAGHATHMGEFISEQSILTGIHSELDMEALSNGMVVIMAEPEMAITGDNGDQVYIKAYIRIDVTDQSNKTVTGDWILTGGSGKFENVTGSGTVNGLLSGWSIDGTLEYPR